MTNSGLCAIATFGHHPDDWKKMLLACAIALVTLIVIGAM